MVTVRTAEPGDAAAVAALYRSLSDDSFLMRFLSPARDERLLERVSRIPPDGRTVGVVAEEAGRVVGEARCVPSPDGPELGMAVADDHRRRGIGRLLLGALRAEAAERGVDAVVAAVRVDNAPMLHLLAASGAVSRDRTDAGVALLELATDGGMPRWPDRPTRGRVLVEGPGWWDTPEMDALRAAGYELRQCQGPSTRMRRACPLLSGGTCRLAAGADAIVCHVHDEQGAVLLDTHDGSWPGRALPRRSPEWRERLGRLLDSPAPVG